MVPTYGCSDASALPQPNLFLLNVLCGRLSHQEPRKDRDKRITTRTRDLLVGWGKGSVGRPLAARFILSVSSPAPPCLAEGKL